MKLKFVLAILVVIFYANIANAQNTLNNIGLSSSTPASVAYSLRLLSSSYAGPLVRIKVGTSFYDVYPDLSTNKFSLNSKISASISTYNAAVSVASANALSSIITAGSTNATVAIWYDQSGNGVHVLSSSATASIITAGSIVTINGQPTIKFSSTDSFLSSTSTVNYSSQSGATVNAIAQNESTTSWFGGIIGTADAGGYPGYNITYSSREGYESDGHGCEYGSGIISTDPKMITNIFINSSTNLSKIYVNSVLKTNTAVTTNTCSLFNVSGSVIYIGAARGNSGLSFNGNISEAIIFPKQLVDGERNPLETNQTATYFAPGVSITSSATNNTSCSGSSVTFTANIYNFTSTPTYQWTKNGIAIPGANSATYSTTTLSNNDQIKVWVNAGINNSAIVSNGLLLNLDASNPGSYAGTGNNWYDLSGNNNHATLMNSPTYDATSGSIVTNGTNQYISIPQFSTANTNITMQAWVYVNLNTTGTFMKNGTGGGGYSIGIGNGAYDQVGSNVVMLLYGRGWIGSGVSYGTAGWKLVTLTLDGSSTARAYVNGSLIGTYTWTTPTSPAGSFNIGANIGDGNIYYNGKFAAAYFYNRALSLTEIQQNYNAFATKTTGYGSNTITNSITGAIPIMTVVGDGCVNKTTLTTSSGLTSYAWYKDNVAISGATTNTYIPSVSGSYQVQVTSGSCVNTSTITAIYTCGRNADGRMTILESSTTLVSADGALNNGKGVDERGFILTKPWAYGTVVSPYTSKVWLDRNLGATQVATGVNDAASYGDLYQWGRATDGGQLRTASTTTTQLPTYTTLSTYYVTTQPWTSDANWNTKTGSIWNQQPWNNTDGGVNNPCPTGYRVPTTSEWTAELNGMISAGLVTNSNTATNIATGAFSSFLKIPQAGVFENGGNTVITTKTVFWTTDRLDTYSANEIRFWPTQGAYQNANWYRMRYSVRCITK